MILTTKIGMTVLTVALLRENYPAEVLITDALQTDYLLY